MTKPVSWSIAAFFIVLSGSILWTTILVTKITKQAYEETRNRVDYAISLLDRRMGDVILTTNLTAESTDKRVAAIQEDANRQLTLFRADINRQLSQVVPPLSATIRGLNRAVDQVNGTLPQVNSTVATANATVRDVDEVVRQSKGEVIGLLRDSRVATAEVARTTIYIRQRTPDFLNNFQNIELDIKKSTESSVQASAATAAMMKNLQKATNPLPAWLRIPLSITGAIAPTASGVVTSLAATGAFQK